MGILFILGLTLGIINLVFFITATIVIVYNKKMTTFGKIFRIVLILLFPLVGPFLVLLQVLDWREKEMNAKKAKLN